MNDYIYKQVQRLVKKYHTRDPFEILENMNVIVVESDKYETLKGYCFMSCQSTYTVINTFLPEPVKRIVAAHELGHIILHRHQLKMAPMKDSVLYDMTSQTEYEANMFAADLLINDDDIHTLSKEDMDYFSMCKYLCTTPDVMSFKLFSLIRRGYTYDLPMGIDSRFLGK